ncbi:MAG: PLDc N-terminal domain-containing protein [Rhodobacter sp.]|nr:PLDc N-terminal domain-containing protein [Rhodobacter sp.]
MEASAAWMLSFALHYVLQLAVLVRAMTRPEREPASRLAWMLVILAVPGAGVVLYLLLGEVNPGRRVLARLRRQRADLPVMPPGAVPVPVPDTCRAAFDRAASVNGFAPLGGNTASLSDSGASAMDRLIDDLEAATDTVHILVYIWLDDATGRRLAEAAIRAARRGVTVRCMVDGLGSRRLLRSGTWEAMRKAGVRTGVAFSTRWAALRMVLGRIDIRNHRKLFVIDGRIVHVGSRNCADPEFAIKPRFAPWVDILLRVEGPVAWQTQQLFVSDWAAHAGEDLTGLLTRPMPEAPVTGGFPGLVFGSGPGFAANAVPDVAILALAAARHEVVISTPYFVPTTALDEQLRSAALRGVAVTLILPARNDSRFVGWASRAFYRGLLRAGVRVLEFRPGLLHAKTLTVDGHLAMIGSANLDRRSFELNFENNLLLSDPAVTQAIRARQDQYAADSDVVALDSVARWSLPRRLLHNLAATISPVL